MLEPVSPEVVRSLIREIRSQYSLPWLGLHGISHWARVYENGRRLAPSTGADPAVVLLFSLFHDACRVNEGWDQGHGSRGAELAGRLRGRRFDLSPDQFQLLYEACARHTDGLTEADPTVMTCWDADRLDLARAGIRPAPDQLCTGEARSPELIAWASARSVARAEPDFLRSHWLADGAEAAE